jgi:hypothetical protein
MVGNLVTANSHPDAELLRLWAEFEPLYQRANTPGLPDEETDAFLDQAGEIEYEIHATPAHTLVGLAVRQGSRSSTRLESIPMIRVITTSSPT